MYWDYQSQQMLIICLLCTWSIVLLIFSELHIKMYITMLEKCVRLFLKLTYWTHKTHRWLYIKEHLTMVTEKWQSFLLHLDSRVKSLPSSTYGLYHPFPGVWEGNPWGTKPVFERLGKESHTNLSLPRSLLNWQHLCNQTLLLMWASSTSSSLPV